ncbi:MAG: DUF4147 domain-containing protein [Erythrobacter sp.]
MNELLRHLFDTAVAAAQPAVCLPVHLPLPTWAGRTVVIAVGKAAVAMAHVAARIYGPQTDMLVIAPNGVDHPSLAGLPRTRVMLAAHPTPDAASLEAGAAALALAEGLTEGDCLVALISGGGSALMEALVEGVSLEQLRAFNQVLLGSGLPIQAINAARRSVSRIKGGVSCDNQGENARQSR